MIRLFFVLLCLPLMSWAEPAPIRTGEHETFSRFVIGIGSGTSWTIGRSDDGFLLVLDGHEDGFDTSAVFERIPRERVLSVSQSAANELFFQVDCKCEANAFLWQSGQLVVDIISSGNPVDEAQVRRPQTRRSTPLLVPDDQHLELPNLLALHSTTLAPLTLTRPVEATAGDVAVLDRTDISVTEAALIEGVARAASQGFLDANIASHVDPEPDQQNPSIERTARQIPLVEAAPARHPGVGISTAMDRDLAAVRDILGVEIGKQCLSADLFQINQWGDDRALHTQVADLADALAGEFGEQPLEAQNQLARLYLHFGFGAEARVVLTSDPAQSQDRMVLIQLAGLIDQYDVATDLIVAQAGCETPGAMWAFIAQPTEIDEDRKNQITQSFLALPQPLRGQIAPRLARQFSEVGEVEAAAHLLRATDHSDAASNHETVAARALLAERQDNPEEAIAALKQEAEGNARISPDSLIRLIELGLENDTLPKETDLTLAAAMRQEHRGTAMADRLAVAEANGRTQLGQFQAAFDLLEQREDQEALDALNLAAVEMSERAEVATFLGFAFKDPPNGLTPHSENRIAARLIDLGFSDRAADFLRGPAQLESAAERRYLRAQTAIGVEDHIGAIEGLTGLTTPRANELRARAYAGLGDHGAALSAQAAGAADVDEATLQFRAEAWDRLTLEDDDALSAFAETVLRPSTEDPVDTLLDRREVLAQSQESRRAVEALLLRFDGTPAPD